MEEDQGRILGSDDRPQEAFKNRSHSPIASPESTQAAVLPRYSPQRSHNVPSYDKFPLQPPQHLDISTAHSTWLNNPSCMIGSDNESQMANQIAQPEQLMNLILPHLPVNFEKDFIDKQNLQHCQLCGSSFSKISVIKNDRRTHCRRCGKTVCGPCA